MRKKTEDKLRNIATYHPPEVRYQELIKIIEDLDEEVSNIERSLSIIKGISKSDVQLFFDVIEMMKNLSTGKDDIGHQKILASVGHLDKDDNLQLITEVPMHILAIKGDELYDIVMEKIAKFLRPSDVKRLEL